MNRTLRSLLLSLALGPVALVGCHGGHEVESTAQHPPANEAWLTVAQVKDAQLRIAPVAEENVGGVITTSGKVTFDDQSVSRVFSPVTGRVTRLLAQLGQPVKKGAPLTVIESPDLDAAASDLAKAEADLGAADRDLKRQKELFDAHAGSRKDYEAAQATFERATAEAERARRKVHLLRPGRASRHEVATQEYTLRAPIEGEVVARNINPGTEVQGQYSGGTDKELFTVGDLDSVWVMADVFEIDLARVKVGARVGVHVVAYPKATFEGTVDWVSAALDPTSRTARVRCRIPNKDRLLKPEMYATVSITVDGRRALAIPPAAVLRLADQTLVFVEVGNSPDGRVRFERRPVVVDEESGGDLLPVLRGLRAGDRLVTSGAILLSEQL